jgi:hypothetical protein
MVGEQFDSSNDEPRAHDVSASGGTPFLGVNFACCGVYTRVYMNRAGTHYVGHCPRCARPVTFRIGPDGSPDRFYTAY